eukprot:GDKH01007628.1.p1 GENE.GDKH01007628.1~~GDKH01007628.1.p1  ORF type:complete len:188 (-),score=38.07 GDKH01007628.1:144-707(-)
MSISPRSKNVRGRTPRRKQSTTEAGLDGSPDYNKLVEDDATPGVRSQLKPKKKEAVQKTEMPPILPIILLGLAFFALMAYLLYFFITNGSISHAPSNLEAGDAATLQRSFRGRSPLEESVPHLSKEQLRRVIRGQRRSATQDLQNAIEMLEAAEILEANGLPVNDESVHNVVEAAHEALDPVAPKDD